MSRLEAAFTDGPAFIPYLVVGDPSPAASRRYIEAVVDAGADIVELGLPFSEPIAEGPTIQRGVNRALSAGMTPIQYFSLVEELSVDIPLICMTYYNLLVQYGDGPGPEAFVARATEVGIDGFVIPDLPIEEAEPLLDACNRHDRDLVFIVAPTTTANRRGRVRERADGFLYVQARMGTTGARRDLSKRTALALEALDDWSIPKAVGFGISRPEHAARVVDAGADGAIVGSALVEIVEAGVEEDASTAVVADRLADHVGAFVEATHRAGGIDPRVRSILAHARRGREGSATLSVQGRSLPAALDRARDLGRVPLIAEVKFASPSGDTRPTGDPVAIATTMVERGAAAISVLTEPTHFDGSPEMLTAIRDAVDVPVLRKDFVFRPSQIDLVAADAVLLIARFLDDLEGMIDAARARGMQPLVEVHTIDELDAALAAGADLIGVNNRDLTELSVDLSTVEDLAPRVPEDVTLIAESGIAGCTDVERMIDSGADGLLIGSAIMEGPIDERVRTFVACLDPREHRSAIERAPAR